MKYRSITVGLLAAMLSLPMAACSQHDQTADNQAESSPSKSVADAVKEVDEKTSPSFIAAEVKKGIDQAKLEMATQDIDVDSVHINGHGHHHDNSNLPKAVITPQGELVIAGKTVQATPEQHTLLVDYRQRVIDIADAGMDIGASGASLGATAARKAILGALTGKSDKDVEQEIKPQAEQIKAAAMKLCHRMPDLLATQQKLAAAMPEFRPYASMTQQDVDDCGKDMDMDND